MKSVCFWVFLCLCGAAHAAEIHVLVWDEQQPEQLKVYPHYLGEQIAAHLRTQPGLEVRSVRLADEEQGLTNENIEWAEVVVWWGHVKNGAVDPKKAALLVQRIREGKLSLIALHSAHWSEPFVQAMRERTKQEARLGLPSDLQDKTRFEFITPERFRVPKADEPLTPSFQMTKDIKNTNVLRVVFPMCVFPAFRADGAPSHVTTLLPAHPIARGVPQAFDIPHTEMYSEPFHVPKPDAVIFEERWDRGEHFRSGCVWKVGKGKVFYFRPGHETYGVYLEPIPLKIVANAVQWLASGRQ